jgi:signal transduction histidine kinase
MNSTETSPADRNFIDTNILIVDDTPLNLGVIVEFLQSYGFGIRIARSGESALKRVQYDHPHIILLDVLMPGIDGFETCRRLKANPVTRDIPVIFMTSLTSIEDKVKGFEAGAVDYVTKPLDREEVLVRVSTHLRLMEMSRTLQAQHEQLRATSQAEKARLFEAVSQQRQQLRTLTTRLTEVQEAERKQLARELHDEMGQTLTAISINLAAIANHLPKNCLDPIQERLTEAAALTEQTLEQIREMSLNLRPPMLDDLGLSPTLRWYIKRYAARVGLKTEFKSIGLEERLSPELETTLYRVVQEGLTNIARHAQATSVKLALTRTEDNIHAEIEDNGRGFKLEETLNHTAPNHGAGLLGIRERITLLSGEFTIHTHPGEGTRLAIDIPLKIMSNL